MEAHDVMNLVLTHEESTQSSSTLYREMEGDSIGVTWGGHPILIKLAKFEKCNSKPDKQSDII